MKKPVKKSASTPATKLATGSAATSAASPAPGPDHLSRSPRSDGRFPTTAGHLDHLLRARPPQLAFDPTLSAASFERWRSSVRARHRRLLDLPRLTAQPAPRMLDRQQRDGYSLERWEIYPEPASVLTVFLLVPHRAAPGRRAPAVVCLPGSDHPKERLAGEPELDGKGPFLHEDMARQFAQAGFVAVALENPGTAGLFDARAPHWTRHAFQLLWLGRPYEALATFHGLVALRWLKTLPFVDPSRLAVSGHSLGAKPALHLGLIDPAIKAVVWNDYLCVWRMRPLLMHLEPNPPWHYIPGQIRWFDYTDLMAALAPTPLLVTEGGRSSDFAILRRAYALAGAPRNVRLAFMPNFRNPANRTLDRAPIPDGITDKEMARYYNFDHDHYFKGDVAVPWIRKMLAPR